MNRNILSLTAAAVACVLTMAAAPTHAATVTNVFTEHFDDATLEAGLSNANSTPISGGIADLNGSNPANTAQGFTFSNTAYDSASGPTVSFIMEAVIPDATTASNLDTLFSFNGFIGIRRDSSANWEIFRGVGSALFTSPTDGDHVALVFTENDTSDVIEAYVNGTLVATLAGSVAASAVNSMGFGLETWSNNRFRGFDGSLDAIAFSTFTGTFDDDSDFVLLNVNVIPTPAALPAGLGLLALTFLRRKRGV